MKTLRFLLLLFTACFTLLAASLAFAQGTQPRPVTDDDVNRVAKGLYCPVCENIPLDVCPTQACIQWRELIREKLSQGWSDAQVKQYFVDQYGDRVLATPPVGGLNWLVYLIPPIIILFGVFILYRTFKAWKKPVQQVANAAAPGSNSDASSPPTDEYIQRLEEELKKR